MKFKILKRFKVGSVNYDVRLVEYCGDNDDFGKWNIPYERIWRVSLVSFKGM